jgi:hypothetical protein
MFALGADSGGGPRVQVFRTDPAGGAPTKVADFYAFDPGFTGGVRVAVGDLDGDGVPDLAVAAGPGGGPHVKVFRGLPGGPDGTAAGFDTGSPFASFYAYAPGFTGGVTVAIGPIVPGAFGSATGYLVTGAGAGGGPHVKVFLAQAAGLNLANPLASFFAYDESFRGGVNVAAGSVADAVYASRTFIGITPEPIRVVTGAGQGGGPHVKVFDGDLSGIDSTAPTASFFAFATFTGGVSVATRTSIDAANPLAPTPSSSTDVLAAAGPGGPPEVRVFTGFDRSPRGLANPPSLTPTFDFTVGDPAFRGGLRVTGVYTTPVGPLSQISVGINGNAFVFAPVGAILVGFGPGSSGYQILRLNPDTAPFLVTPDAAPVLLFAGTFDANFLGGIFVG